jgi:SAM-dependent methyltransferase
MKSSLRLLLIKRLEKRKLNKWFNQQFAEFNKLTNNENRALKENLYPCLFDNTSHTVIEPTYFYQDSWAFEQIVKNLPKSHIDIGSQHTFVALLSKVVPLTMIDIRPLSLSLQTINFIKGDILHIPFEDNSIESLSSLCVVEHIGLGRYGDPLDPEGSIKAFKELARVIKKGGNLYLSVPVEKNNKVYFNAHRSFNIEYVLSFFKDFDLIDSKYIYGKEFTISRRDGFGTGCFHLKKNK